MISKEQLRKDRQPAAATVSHISRLHQRAVGCKTGLELQEPTYLVINPSSVWIASLLGWSISTVAFTNVSQQKVRGTYWIYIT